MRLNPLFPVAAACLLTACTPRHTITGRIEGLTNDTLFVNSWAITDLSSEKGVQKSIRRDTVITVNGKFRVDIPIAQPSCVTISPAQLMTTCNGERYCLFFAHMRFFLCENEHVRARGQIDSTILNYTLTGTQLCEDLSEINDKIRPLLIEMDRIQDKIAAANHPEQLILYGEHEKIRTLITAIRTNYIRTHPDRPLSGYCLGQIMTDSVYHYYEIMGEAARNSIFRPYFEPRLHEAEKRRLYQLARARIVPGTEAPDFTLKNTDGKDFTLSSLRGKYVVLDFWGSWCRWCIKGFPEMKKQYGRYKGKLEIVGIACNDTPEKWLAAIEEHGLPWINVINPQNASLQDDVAIRYGADRYPTKIIIDREGKLVGSYTGEDPAFYEKLAEMLK